MSIGESLQKARQNKHLTQKNVAERLYVTRQTISRWEQEKTMPNIYALKDLAKLYDVSIDSLIENSPHSLDREEGSKMKNINWMALFGMIWFNIIFSLGAFTAVFGILLGAWITIGALIAAPFLLAGEWILVVLMQLPWPASLEWYQVPLALVLCALGVGAIPLAKNLTSMLVRFCKQYIRYNVKAVSVKK